MDSQKLLNKLEHKVRNRTLFLSDQSLRSQVVLEHRSKTPVRQVDICFLLKINNEQNKFYTFHIHYCSQYHTKVLVRERTKSKWAVKKLCAQKKIAFELITPQAFVISIVAYKQRIKSLLFLMNKSLFTFLFVQPFQILGLERLYEVCGTKKRCLPVTKFYKTMFCYTLFLQKRSFCIPSLFKKQIFFKLASVRSTYGESITKSKACSTSAKFNGYILKHCEKLNNVSDLKVLTLRSSAILFQERKKHKIIRPLLDFKRETITMICKDLQIPVYPDKSNRSVQYSRNRIRKQIIPSIKHFINPQVENSLFRVAQLLQKEQFFVYSLLKNTPVNLNL